MADRRAPGSSEKVGLQYTTDQQEVGSSSPPTRGTTTVTRWRRRTPTIGMLDGRYHFSRSRPTDRITVCRSATATSQRRSRTRFAVRRRRTARRARRWAHRSSAACRSSNTIALKSSTTSSEAASGPSVIRPARGRIGRWQPRPAPCCCSECIEAAPARLRAGSGRSPSTSATISSTRSRKIRPDIGKTKASLRSTSACSGPSDSSGTIRRRSIAGRLSGGEFERSGATRCDI